MKVSQFEFHLTDLSENNSKFCDLNVKIDEEEILRCEGRLKFAPIPQETRSPILLNDKDPPSKLIILNIYESKKRISAKYTLNEFRQKFWLLCGKCIVKNITFLPLNCSNFRLKQCERPYIYQKCQRNWVWRDLELVRIKKVSRNNNSQNIWD